MGVYNQHKYGPDWPLMQRNVVKEQLLPKYDGRRAYYAGCLKPELSQTENKIPSGGTQEAGTRVYVFIAAYRDAQGRVVFSDYSEKAITLSANESVEFRFVKPNTSKATFGYGLGATAYAKQAYTNATSIKVLQPHGIIAGDIITFAEGIAWNGKIINTTAIKEAKVIGSRYEDLVLDTPVTLTQWQPITANQTILVLRTKVGGTEPYVVKEIPRFENVFVDPSNPSFSIGDQVFEDKVADSTLFEKFTLPEVGREGYRPIMGQAMAVHNGRLVLANKSVLTWSNPEAGTESLEQVPPTNSILIGGTVGGPITALASANDTTLYAFRSAGIYAVSGEFESENGGPNLKQTTITENDLGCSNSEAISTIGGALICHGKGRIFSILDGMIFPEIGAPIEEKLRGVSPYWKAFLLTDPVTIQVKCYLRRPLDLFEKTTSSYQNRAFVLDGKNYSGALSAQDSPALSRQSLESSWFNWNWISGFPTHGVESYKGKEYYISFNVAAIEANEIGGDIAKKKALYSRSNGVYVQFREGEALQYTDAGYPIKNSLVTTPLIYGGADLLKDWNLLKVYKYISESDKYRISDWNATVSLAFDLSNNFQAWEALIQEDLLSVYNKNLEATLEMLKKHTQGVVALQGQCSPAIEIKIETNTLYKSLNLSALVVDFNVPYSTDALEVRADA